MAKRNLDTAGIGIKAVNIATDVILQADHLFQKIDGDADIGIDGYIRVRKKVSLKKTIKGKVTPCIDFVDTGALVGVQIKGVTKIPKTGAKSYYINLSDKQKFGVNFKTGKALSDHKVVWENFIGPVILIFVEIETRKCWWADLNDISSYSSVNDYSVLINKVQTFDSNSFKQIKKLGKELFVKKELITINTGNHCFPDLNLTDFKSSAKNLYNELGKDGQHSPITNQKLGNILYTKNGWKHITRLNRRKMRIFNSLLLLYVSKLICEQVQNYSKVKKGEVRKSKQFIKKVEYLTLRA
jgi:hypothetical protein